VNSITDIGILMSKAASPPIKPPSTQELSEFANTRITAAPTINTIAAAATLINIVPLPAIMKRMNNEKYIRKEAKLQEQ